jgi:hypothetical protein
MQRGSSLGEESKLRGPVRPALRAIRRSIIEAQTAVSDSPCGARELCGRLIPLMAGRLRAEQAAASLSFEARASPLHPQE